MNLPVHYDYMNAYNASHSPSTVHVRNTGLSRYFARYLIQKAFSVFKWDMPSNWDRDYFLYTLYTFGYISVINTDKFGVIPQQCGLTGYNVFYRPALAYVQNPLLSFRNDLLIGRDCELVKLQPDYGGIWDKVSYYADVMAVCAEAVGVNMMNSKTSYVFAAENKAAAESFKGIFDRIASGELAVVFDKNLLDKTTGKPSWQMFEQNVGGNYIADKLLSDMRKIEDMFATDIGLPNANTEKRERMIVDEVNANNVETHAVADLWLETLKDGCERVNAMFGAAMDKQLSVDWRYKTDVSDNVVDNKVNGGDEQ